LVKVGASIDGMGDVLEYQRYPAKWGAIERNLHVVDNLPDNVRAWISATVTLTNVWQFPDFMLWKIDQNFKKINKTEIINYHVCHRPWSSNIRVLPYEYKTQLEDFYNSKRTEFEKYDAHIVKSANRILDSIVKYARAEDESNRLSQFIDFTRKLDNVRNQNIVDVVPQYKKLFDK
jgi:hypothetical protein